MLVDPPKRASDLARRLGITPQALSAHRKRPNAPSIDDPDAWQVFLAAYGKDGVSDTELRRKIAIKKLALLNEAHLKAERENKVRSGEMVEFSEVRKVALDLMSFIFGERDRERQTWPALLKGRTELEIANILDQQTASFKAGVVARLEGFTK